jgi:DDE superfamily endonuclease
MYFEFLEVGAKFVISKTAKGYQTQESFFDFVSTHLVKELDENGIKHTAEHPFIYFLDGHVSHNSFKLFQWCKENHIIIVLFFPNATHILQMCDVAIFGAFKGIYSKEIQKWKLQSGNRDVTLIDVVKILKTVQDQVMTSDAIKNGFRATGIYPLNIENCHLERCLPKSTPEITLSAAAANNFNLHEGKICKRVFY